MASSSKNLVRVWALTLLFPLGVADSAVASPDSVPAPPLDTEGSEQVRVESDQESDFDDPIRLLIGFGPLSMSSSGRIGVYYDDSKFSGAIDVEVPMTRIVEREWLKRLCVTGGISIFSPLGFDRVAFREREELSDSAPVRAEDGRLTAMSAGLRAYPLLGRLLRAFLEIRVASGSLREEYRHSTLQGGDWFPSGTRISKNSTTALRGIGLRAGLRAGSDIQPFIDVEYLRLSADDGDFRINSVRAGVAIVIDGTR